MAIEPKRVSADAVMEDLLAIANRNGDPLKDRLVAVAARIDRFKTDLEELAIRHQWPPPKIDQFTGHLEHRLETSLADSQLKTEHRMIYQHALKRL